MKFEEIGRYLAGFNVGIAGAGGLGSNCAVALARSGIGKLVICDFDVVEKANLNRQYYFADQVGMKKVTAISQNINRINSKTDVKPVDIVLDRSNIPVIFSGCDVIVEAFDRADMKEMIIETVQSKMAGIPLIVGSGMAGWGANESIRFRKIDDFLFICGDESTEASEENPVMAPRVGIVANMQANAVIQILIQRKLYGYNVK